MYGFEEALGYLVNPETVRDKDGISAMVAVLGLAADARAEGRTLADLLAELADEIGHFASAQVSIRVEDLSIIGSTMARLRADPPPRSATSRSPASTTCCAPPRDSRAATSCGSCSTADPASSSARAAPSRC